MVYPVSSPLTQQIPAANTFQPGGQAEGPKRPEIEEASDSGSVRSQSVDTRNSEKSTVSASSSRAEDTGGVSASTERGTTVDLSV